MSRRFYVLSFAYMMLLAAGGFSPAAEAVGANAAPRIISLYAGHSEVLLRLGARDNLIGVSRQETYAGPETAGWSAPSFTIRDDVEKFLAAKPDIILARPQHLAGAGHLRAALERAGIQLVALQVTRADELYDYWRQLGALVGRESEADAMIRDFDAEVERYRDAAKRLSHRPGVFLEAMHREVKTFIPESIPVWLVEAAGGINAAPDAEPASSGVAIASYGPERLLAAANRIEIFVSQQGAMNRTTPEQLQGRTIYQPLAAFKTGQVYQIDEAILARPTPSLLLGLALLAQWTGLAENMRSR
ncbi:MAG: ABC transporter substrate-binding protein [Planctomycetes bacterium]|nr:ABC transporter substrate-binding protein [Planctomycetota bacterium]